MRIRSVSIKNFRAFTEFVLELSGNSAIVIGLAGVGLVLTSLLVISLIRTIMRTPKTTPTPPQRKMPGLSRSSSRTSALLTEQGRQSLKQGDLQAAYDLFSQAITLNPVDIQAWLGKGLVAQNETEKRICFQRVLALEPNNQVAQAELTALG